MSQLTVGQLFQALAGRNADDKVWVGYESCAGKASSRVTVYEDGILIEESWEAYEE